MSESIGQRLKREREARYLTLERASDDTRIRIVFLQALEADDYSVIPSAAQGRGFLRNYAEYLELNLDEMIVEIQKNRPSPAEEISGPLPPVNLREEEIPPLTDVQQDGPARSFLSSLFGGRPKADSAHEIKSTEPVQMETPVPVIQQKEVTEVKAEEQSQPIEADQAVVKDDPKPSLISKLLSLPQVVIARLPGRARVKKIEPESVPEPEAEKDTPVIESAVPSSSADLIFAEIGAQLRARREMISLTIDEVERHTKLRAVFVKALEDGALDKLPSPVQTRGMLANYAAFLDLDTDTILLRFADFLQTRRHEKYAETPREKIQTEVVTSMPFLRSFIAGDLIFGVVMIAILAALAIWGVGRVIRSQDAQNVAATAPSIVEVLGDASLATATLDLTVVPAPSEDDPLIATATLEVPVTPGETANVVVSVFAVERVFVRISVDGKVAFEGRLAPRETKLFEAENQVVILTGNAAALRINYNGNDLGLMGSVGEVISRVYLITGVVTPTATIPPTPTSTLPATITETPTITPTFTPTVTPPDGG